MNHMPVISVDNLSKSYKIYKNNHDFLWELLSKKIYHDVFWALRNISFEINEKERIGIIGPNGAGKSTFFNIAGAQIHPTSGEVLVLGEKFGSVDVFELRYLITCPCAQELCSRQRNQEPTLLIGSTLPYLLHSRHNLTWVTK